MGKSGDSQYGATNDGERILKELSISSEDESSSKSTSKATPFKHEYQAYHFALSLGIASGKRKKGTFHTKWIESTITRSGNYNIGALVQTASGLSATDDWIGAANEYANWGLQHIEEVAKLPSGVYKLTRLLKSERKSEDKVDSPTEDGGEGGSEVSSDSDAVGTLRWPPKEDSWKTATWLIEGQVAGAERPGRKGSGDKSQVEKSKVDEWIEAAKSMDPPIKSIICLLDEDQLSLYKSLDDDGGLVEYYRSNGFEVENETVKNPDDYKSLPKGKIAAASKAFGRMPKPVLVHCSAARGRTADAINKGILPNHFKD